MEVLSEQEMTSRVDFARPLHPKPEERESLWCIPFEYGGTAKGTKISISKAKEISAELRAAVAEAERRELLRAFNGEKERAEGAEKREVMLLKRQMRHLYNKRPKKMKASKK